MAGGHAAALVAFGGERAYARMRKHVAWYTRGMPGAALLRERVNSARSYRELVETLAGYREYLERR